MNLHILSNKNMNHETQRKVSSSLITKRFLGQFQQRRKLQICWGQPPSNTYRKPWQTTMTILETDRTWNTVIFVSVSYKGRKKGNLFLSKSKKRQACWESKMMCMGLITDLCLFEWDLWSNGMQRIKWKTKTSKL
jgi:hypothetical protein